MNSIYHVNALERDLVKAQALLRGGLASAREHLQQTAHKASQLWSCSPSSRLKPSGSFCLAPIVAVEVQLRELHYLDADYGLDNPDDLERTTKPLLAALKKARQEIVEIASTESEHVRMLDDSLLELQLHIEMVRLHLILVTNSDDRVPPELKTNLGATLAAAARKATTDPRIAKQIVQVAVRELGPLKQAVGNCLGVIFDRRAGQGTSAVSPEDIDSDDDEEDLIHAGD
ncbi:MAG: hypothetical protein GWQ05_14160 [Verrucomicrobiaceae bacterium]|nr:hypothetical protein [Verrucomicrobiaceae bacterium]NCF92082.1 hypothetical protein [Verrucomicrobiaceae bacterium]